MRQCDKLQSTAMDEQHAIPPPYPKIPLKPLWISLAVPPLISVIPNLLLGLLTHGGDAWAYTLWSPPLALCFIIVFLFPYKNAVKHRYRGTSLVLLGWAYVIGQIIVCTALWFGTCVMAFSN